MHRPKTIFAPATASGVGAVTIIRVSGPDSDQILRTFLSRELPAHRLATLAKLRDPQTAEILDEALILRFAEGSSFTGEESFEFHLHGGLAVRDRVCEALLGAGAYPAKPGEFTRRAFQAGRLDLAQAEAIDTLARAESDQQRRIALQVLDGEVGQVAERWRIALIEILALLESSIDFVEEEVADSLIPQAADRLGDLKASLQKELDRGTTANVLAKGLDVVILGPPNAGKSSLLNALCERDVVITSPIAGTTRDIVEAEILVNDVRVRIADTAGVRETLDEIELEGIRRAEATRSRAAVAILVLSKDSVTGSELENDIVKSADLVVWNKSDLSSTIPEHVRRHAKELYCVSVMNGDAAESVRRFIAKKLPTGRDIFSATASSARRFTVIQNALAAIDGATSDIASGGIEIGIVRIKQASRWVDGLLSEIADDDVLDEIFSRFCVGK